MPFVADSFAPIAARTHAWILESRALASPPESQDRKAFSLWLERSTQHRFDRCCHGKTR